MQGADIGNTILRAARRFGDRECLVAPGRRLTYGQLAEGAARIGSGLRAGGLERGDRVAVVLRNVPEYVELIFGAGLADLVVVPVNRRLHPEEVGRILADCGAKILVTEAAFGDLVRYMQDTGAADLVIVGRGVYGETEYNAVAVRGRPEVGAPFFDDDTVGSIYYTSGTTGTQKGVTRSHAANFAMALGGAMRAPSEPGDTWLYAIPMHSAGFYGLGMATLLQGGRLVLLPDFEPAEILDVLSVERVTTTLLVPTMWEMLLRQSGVFNVKLPLLRNAFWGGMPLLKGTLARLDAWLPEPCVGCYGLTEATCATYSVPELYRSGRPESSGFPISTMEVRVVDDAGTDVPAGEYGEVVLRGSLVMSGYLNRPDLTAQTVKDGWLSTGDWGRLDEDGALTVVDRKKDMIISGGENIYPAELENSLSGLEGVHEVAVVGMPDDTWGQVVCAFVVAEGVTEADVVEHCVRNHAPYKKPRRVIFVDELPKNALGKIVKPELVKAAGAGEKARRTS